VAFRPNWYENERGGGRGAFSLRGAASWSGMRWIVTLTAAVFVLQILEQAFFRTDHLSAWGALRAWWAEVLPDGRIAASAPLTFNVFFPVQLVSYALLHDDVWHIAFNMLYLWFFGPDLEAWMGRASFLRLYVGGAIVGGLAQWGWWLATGTPGAVVGASGAVYAIMVLSAFRWPHRTLLLWFVLPVPVWLLVGVRVVGDIFAFINPPPHQTVAVLAHLGGAVFAAIWHVRGDALERFLERRKRAAAVRQTEALQDNRREMDRILAKIQASGLNSLDGGERAFLERRSRELRDQGR
jgi:membrane associated rhomboid family serine protease